ncbi:MAG: hypothetical protein E2O46_06185 [Ignavibacteria bacterium]|nr:MAG: hypothetical protein E2O46_06185 [Ignavibacteria bacterium]
MIKRLLLPFFTLLLFTLLLYRCSDSIIVPGNENNLITNPSFEENGNASLNGWIIAGDTINQFTTDIPPNGGNWAITINSVWISPLTNGIYTTVKLSTGIHIYRFSVWAKYQEVTGSTNMLIIKPDTTIVLRSIQITDTLWKEYSVIDTIAADVSDSLRIILSGGGSQILFGKSYFDLCTLELLE